jgi:hypothetical protein
LFTPKVDFNSHFEKNDLLGELQSNFPLLLLLLTAAA